MKLGLVLLLSLTAASCVVGASAEAGRGIRLPVVRCSTPPNASGFPTQFKASGLPRSSAADVGARVARQLTLYSNGWLTLLAPRGWTCRALVGATGHVFLSVLPPGARAQVIDVSKRTRAVTAELPSARTAEGGGLVCPFFPDATPQPSWAHCRSVPDRERFVRLGPHIAAFDDPPGIHGSGDPSGGAYPANGVVIYATSRASLATCTLPEKKHAECTAILNDFIARRPS